MLLKWPGYMLRSFMTVVFVEMLQTPGRPFFLFALLWLKNEEFEGGSEAVLIEWSKLLTSVMLLVLVVLGWPRLE